MKIYFTGIDGLRRLQDCNLSETEIPYTQGTDGVKIYKMYTIFNAAPNETAIVTFGGQQRIAGNLRDVFWRNITDMYKRKNKNCIFDTDEWYGKIKFVSAVK